MTRHMLTDRITQCLISSLFVSSMSEGRPILNLNSALLNVTICLKPFHHRCLHWNIAYQCVYLSGQLDLAAHAESSR